MSKSPKKILLLATSLFAAATTTTACAHTTVKDADVCRTDADVDSLFRVPFRVVDGRIYVDVMVNDKGPFAFAIDTGASGLGRSDASLTKALALPITNGGLTNDGVATASVDMTRFDSLEIGGYRRENIEVITRDYSSRLSADAAISGIIGRDFFADGVLIIDYPNRTMSFSRSLELPAGDAQVVTYERPFRIPVSIGNVQTEGQMDTGANVEFIMPKSLFDKIGGGPLQAAGDATLTNTSLETQTALVPGPFRFGGAEFTNVNVRISERFPELLVGARVLQHHKILIDQRSKRVAVCRPD
ncbi:aspartyl protease family protein [uncultured Sphingorhabdus sp.]|uniref:aspartyl protease family protein n=1 Tax=uncultured Sphingorhabdus sp. TaxID=1686106 RepID=UPI00260D6201|nr:aspartyl protease family protein [uncultured Sphingorhabdus sp.]HMS19072.1 aspartyl protease family protein [Sphingorhabdus sp.]